MPTITADLSGVILFFKYCSTHCEALVIHSLLQYRKIGVLDDQHFIWEEESVGLWAANLGFIIWSPKNWMIYPWLGAHGHFCFGDYDHDLVAFHMVSEEAISRLIFARFFVRPETIYGRFKFYWVFSKAGDTVGGLNCGTDSEPKLRDVKSPNRMPFPCPYTFSFLILSSASANCSHLLRRPTSPSALPVPPYP